MPTGREVADNVRGFRLTEHLRLRRRAEGPAATGLRHLTVIEEAHRLLRQPPPGTAAGPAAHASASPPPPSWACRQFLEMLC